MILKGVFKHHPWEKVKHLLANFRIIPTISTTPLGDSVEIGFQPTSNLSALLEDALSLVEHVSMPENRMIVVFDEFQEIMEVEKGIDRKLRAIMQEQQHVNYIFLGSEESMMTDIFERKKSPFYHFGMLMRLKKIPFEDFHSYITERMQPIVSSDASRIAEEILAFTQCHPYYTQQLASMAWEIALYKKTSVDTLIDNAVNKITETHDLNFERIWMSLNNTDKRIIRMLSKGEKPYEQKSLPTSTTYSSIKKLMKKGFLIKENGYEVEDPFFKQWIIRQSETAV